MLQDIHQQLSFLQIWSPKISQYCMTWKGDFILVYLQEFLLDLSGWDVKI